MINKPSFDTQMLTNGEILSLLGLKYYLGKEKISHSDDLSAVLAAAELVAEDASFRDATISFVSKLNLLSLDELVPPDLTDDTAT